MAVFNFHEFNFETGAKTGLVETYQADTPEQAVDMCLYTHQLKHRAACKSPDHHAIVYPTGVYGHTCFIATTEDGKTIRLRRDETCA